jgi:transcriptional regulator with XRE-family HTH domain
MPRDQEKPPRTAKLWALGRAVKRMRTERGLTQEALGERMERRDHQAPALIERGQRNPTYESLQRLAAALEVRLSEIVALADEILEEEESDSSAADA